MLTIYSECYLVIATIAVNVKVNINVNVHEFVNANENGIVKEKGDEVGKENGKV